MLAVHPTAETRDSTFRHLNAGPDQQAFVIYSSTDLAKFRYDPMNRPIDDARAEQLAAAIRQRNLLPDNPILVDVGYVIIDGQHRHAAATILRVPIYYRFSELATIHDVPGMQLLTKPWSITDRLFHWCEAGNPEYLALRDFMDEFPFISPNAAVRLCHVHFGTAEKTGTRSVRSRNLFYSGEYSANDIPFARRVANAILDYKPYALDFYQHEKFVAAITNLLGNVEYNHERMLAKLSYLSARLMRCASAEDYVMLLNRIYNYKAGSGNVTELRILGWNNARYRPELKQLPTE